MSEPRHSEPKSVRGCCPVDCPDTCSWRVETNAGIAVRLRGDPDHPYTRGVLCNKLKDFIDYSNDPKRLLHPLRRSGAKGSGSFERISWDDALGEIAEKWLAIIDQHGPQSIWPYYGTGSTGMIQGVEGAGRRLWNRLGVVEHQMTICTIAGGVGTGYTLGHNQIGMDPEQLAKSKLIILWGTNTLTSNHHLWRAISTARKSGAHLVVIDPIRSRNAEKADEHFAPIPGSLSVCSTSWSSSGRRIRISSSGTPRAGQFFVSVFCSIRRKKWRGLPVLPPTRSLRLGPAWHTRVQPVSG